MVRGQADRVRLWRRSTARVEVGPASDRAAGERSPGKESGVNNERREPGDDLLRREQRVLAGRADRVRPVAGRRRGSRTGPCEVVPQASGRPVRRVVWAMQGASRGCCWRVEPIESGRSQVDGAGQGRVRAGSCCRRAVARVVEWCSQRRARAWWLKSGDERGGRWGAGPVRLALASVSAAGRGCARARSSRGRVVALVVVVPRAPMQGALLRAWCRWGGAAAIQEGCWGGAAVRCHGRAANSRQDRRTVRGLVSEA